MPEKVFVVTAGSYSDYHIVAIFTDEEAAKALAARPTEYDWDKMAVKEMLLNPNADEIKRGLPFWWVRILIKGDIHSVEEEKELSYIASPIVYMKGWKQPTREMPEHFLVACFAEDAAHAVKIANERRAQAVIEGLHLQ